MVHAAGLSEALHAYLHFFLVLGFSVYLFTSNTESCDEYDGEVDEGVVEEELVDKPGTTNGTLLDILQSILLTFLMRCFF